jgi:dTDP-4-amino-4,6-dideoxygalactose transaminase
MPSFEEYCEEIKKLWDSHWLTNMGVKHQALEAALREYLSCPQVTLFTNGHLALEGALSAFGLTGEVITTPFTFTSTTHAIVRNGLRPVFCDVDPETYTLDPAKIEALITPETSAIVPVHVYGTLCDVEAIETIAKKHGLKVIYDAAHAFGVKKNSVSAACFGDASMFSFHATKVFHTVEGGCVVYKDAGLREKLDHFKDFGLTNGEIYEVGGNAKMSEFHAAMGICNLRRIEACIEARKKVVERYRRHLSAVPGLTLLKDQPGVESNYAYFPVVFDGSKYTRDEAADRLAEQGIFARKYFFPLTNSFDCYRGRPGFDPADTPVAAHVADRVLTLPLFADLAPEDVDRICDLILKS